MSEWDPEDPLRRVRGESRAANRALYDYALMGEGQRSLRGLLARYVKQASDESQTEAPPTTRWPTICTWSSRNTWVARCARFDEQQREAELRDYARRRKEDRDLRIQTLQAYRGKIIRAMKGLEPAVAEWRDVTAALRLVTEELRREFGDDVTQVAQTTVIAAQGISESATLSDEEVSSAARNLALALLGSESSAGAGAAGPGDGISREILDLDDEGG